MSGEKKRVNEKYRERERAFDGIVVVIAFFSLLEKAELPFFLFDHGFTSTYVSICSEYIHTYKYVLYDY